MLTTGQWAILPDVGAPPKGLEVGSGPNLVHPWDWKKWRTFQDCFLKANFASRGKTAKWPKTLFKRCPDAPEYRTMHCQIAYIWRALWSVQRFLKLVGWLDAPCEDPHWGIPLRSSFHTHPPTSQTLAWLILLPEPPYFGLAWHSFLIWFSVTNSATCPNLRIFLDSLKSVLLDPASSVVLQLGSGSCHNMLNICSLCHPPCGNPRGKKCPVEGSKWGRNDHPLAPLLAHSLAESHPRRVCPWLHSCQACTVLPSLHSVTGLVTGATPLKTARYQYGQITILLPAGQLEQDLRNISTCLPQLPPSW